jgi:putative endopeptidase
MRKINFLLSAAMILSAGTAVAADKNSRPEIGSYGFDAAGMDKSVKPGVSFFNFANGSWVKATKIPDDKSNYGMFTALDDTSKKRTREIIEAAASSKAADGTNAQRVGDAYSSFMDEAAIEAKGLAPLQPMLDSISAAKSSADLAGIFASFSTQFTSAPFNTYVYIDERQPDTHIGILGQGGLGLPDKDMYDKSKAQFEPLRAGYKQYAEAMFKLAGFDNAAARAAAVYALEEKLAGVQWTRLENRNPQMTYNKMSPEDLAKLAPGFDWKTWLSQVGLGEQKTIIVQQPTAFTKMASLIGSEPLPVWQDYARLMLLTDAAPMLPKAFVDTHFAFYGKGLSGTPQIKDRWKRGVELVESSMGEAVGELYVAKYFTPDTKKRADELVKNLLVSMGQRLDALAWMSPETKLKAKEKLATYNPKIGYPTKWRDYAKLEIKSGDALGNAQRAAKFEYQRYLAKLGNPVDRDEWGMTPMTVNAYYNPVLNEIVFPAAILQPPFFDPNADAAINYGGIGGVIGHEISHGFDDQGAQYDAKGALKDWWSKDDTVKFKAATARLAAQYDGYCPLPKQCVNGKLTMGENIADLAGLTVAYNAYKLSLGGKKAPIIDGTTGDQRFFYGWAQVWRRIYREKELQNRLVTDVHSPSEYRASVVRNLDAWYKAFPSKPGETLYLKPEDRVRIW